MTDDIKKVPMMRTDNLLYPKDRTLRPRRPIPGLEGFEITQSGLVHSPDGEFLEADPWPLLYVALDDGIYTLDIVAATAAVWLDEVAWKNILTKIPEPAKHLDPQVQAFQGEYQVYKHAIAHITCQRDRSAPYLKMLPPPEGEAGRIEGKSFESYGSFLYEEYRPPSKGGNTKALHIHNIVVEGERYSFFALGTKQWAYVGDTVTFDYVVTPKGYRNILKHSFITVDSKGKAQRRGNRGYKSKLRSAPGRMPGSRREQRS